MIAHGKGIKVFTGNANPALAELICKHLGVSMGCSTVSSFADGECSISINEPVRGLDVFLVQSTCKPVNDSLMEMLVMIDALKRASADFKACCPFHREKTPSFIVSPSRRSFHCFGCGAQGDVFKFLMLSDGMTFPDAVKALAERCGVTLEEENK